MILILTILFSLIVVVLCANTCWRDMKEAKSSPPSGPVLQRRIVCAAMRRSDGLIICGARHYDTIMRQTILATGDRTIWRGADQGFIDNMGVYLTREEAHPIALAAGQIIRRCGGDSDTLYSENLY